MAANCWPSSCTRASRSPDDKLRVPGNERCSGENPMGCNGSRQTGRTRATFGFQYTNLFARDHSFTASYTTSPENTDDVMQAGASYELPLYFANGKVSAFFSESDVDVGNIAGFQVSGAGRFWGVSFTRLLARHGAYAHEWTLGIWAPVEQALRCSFEKCTAVERNQ